MRKMTPVAACGAILFAQGCKPPAKDSRAEGSGTGRVSLKGTYGVKRGPGIEPVLKVEEAKGGGYVFEERTLGEWGQDMETPHTATEMELRRDFGGPVDVPVYGLATGEGEGLQDSGGLVAGRVTDRDGLHPVQRGWAGGADEDAAELM